MAAVGPQSAGFRFSVFIAAGVTLIQDFHWIMYIFGVLLVVSGLRTAFEMDKEVHPEKNPVVELFRRFMPVTPESHSGRFFVKSDKRWLATPLFIVLLMLETTDLVFAIDSVPAVLGITTDPFIVYTSNVFAILGLRSMFFALAGAMKLFAYLHYGLAAVLVFVGAKMVVAGFYKIPTLASLLVIVGLLTVAVMASLLHTARRKRRRLSRKSLRAMENRCWLFYQLRRTKNYSIKPKTRKMSHC